MYKNILIYDVACKTSYSEKRLHNIFSRVAWYIRIYDSTKYLALSCSDEKYERIFDRIRYLYYLYYVKSNFSDAYSREYTKIKFNLDDLPLEKSTI